MLMITTHRIKSLVNLMAGDEVEV